MEEESNAKKGPVRRAHRKSRFGCKQCKKAHIKCDETHPTCNNCVRWGRTCDWGVSPASYSQDSASTAADENPHQPALPMEVGTVKVPPLAVESYLSAVYSAADQDDVVSSIPTPPSDTSARPRSSAMPAFSLPWRRPTPNSSFSPSALLDLELMNHWTVETAPTLVGGSGLLPAWQYSVPQVALKYDFLLHTLLSAAAFHLILQRLGKSQGSDEYHHYLAAGMSHQTQAISLSTRAMENITPENCHAVAAFGMIIAYSAFIAPEQSQPSRGKDPLADMLNNIALYRAIPLVLQTQWQALQAGPLSGILLGVPEPIPSQELSPELKHTFDLLEGAIREDSTTSVADRRIYLTALGSLKFKYLEHIEQPGQEGRRFFWPIFVDKRFLELLEERQKLAMCIFAHYVVVMYEPDSKNWIFSDWAVRVMKYIVRRVSKEDGEMMTLLKWPLQKIGLIDGGDHYEN